MNDVKPGPNEVKATLARAYGPTVTGPQRYDAAIMLSFIREGSEPVKAASFMDVFMDEDQAVQVHAEMGKCLEEIRRKRQE